MMTMKQLPEGADFLPHNESAERAILGVLLYDGDRIVEVVDVLSADDFYDNEYRDIWQAMVNLYKEGSKIDLVALHSELKKITVNTTGSISVLTGLMSDYFSSGNLEKYVEEIKNKSLLRKIVSLCYNTQNTARFDDAEGKAVLLDLEKNVVSVSDTTRDDRPTDAGGILNEVREDMARGSESAWEGFKTGFKELDDRTGGFIPTHVWIVGAYTGTGKTFFILQMILNALKQDAKVALFSTEMDRKMVMLRLLGNLAEIGTINLLKNRLEEDEYERRLEAEKRLGQYKNTLHIFDNVYTVEEIRLKLKKLKLQQGIDLVFVDFIQNMRGAESIYDRMSKASIELQQMAQELGITMVIVSQISQNAAGWNKKESIEYKGAGEIAAVADVGIWITKDKDKGENSRMVYLRKVRHGAPGKFETTIEFPSGRVTSIGGGGIDDEDITSQLE